MTVESVENVSTSSDVPVKENLTSNNTEKPKVSPAQDLRNIQALLVNGIFPGQMAPQVVQSFQLLEKMAVEIEKQQESK
jgi:hypothetical protein